MRETYREIYRVSFMKCIVLPEKLDYDGSQISSLWAYNNFGVQEDSIIFSEVHVT